jgi:hypothetical protein
VKARRESRSSRDERAQLGDHLRGRDALTSIELCHRSLDVSVQTGALLIGQVVLVKYGQFHLGPVGRVERFVEAKPPAVNARTNSLNHGTEHSISSEGVPLHHTCASSLVSGWSTTERWTLDK